ncbi:hypothetical protein K0M31_004736, partial [Melipona bicolor]
QDVKALIKAAARAPSKIPQVCLRSFAVIAAGSRGPLLQISAFSPLFSFFSSSFSVRRNTAGIKAHPHHPLPIEAAISFLIRQRNFFRLVRPASRRLEDCQLVLERLTLAVDMMLVTH